MLTSTQIHPYTRAYKQKPIQKKKMIYLPNTLNQRKVEHMNKLLNLKNQQKKSQHHYWNNYQTAIKNKQTEDNNYSNNPQSGSKQIEQSQEYLDKISNNQYYEQLNRSEVEKIDSWESNQNICAIQNKVPYIQADKNHEHSIDLQMLKYKRLHMGLSSRDYEFKNKIKIKSKFYSPHSRAILSRNKKQQQRQFDTKIKFKKSIQKHSCHMPLMEPEKDKQQLQIQTKQMRYSINDCQNINNQYRSTHYEYRSTKKYNNKQSQNRCDYWNLNKYKTSLQRCREMTSCYDQLKKEITSKMKIIKSSEKLESLLSKNPQKENRYLVTSSQPWKHKRSSSHHHDLNNRKFEKLTKYADISVADFLDKQDPSAIDTMIVRKIQEMKKATHRPRAKTQ